MNPNWIPETEFQYENTKRWRDRFLAEASRLEYESGEIDPLLRQLEIDAARSMAETLTQQMKNYEEKNTAGPVS